MKVAIVVGHNATAKGARAKAPISESEFDYNNKIAGAIERKASPPLKAKVFNRVRASSYAQEIDDVYARVDAWAADLSIELHFNAAAQASATGTETLSSGFVNSMNLAKHVQDAMLDGLKLANRGVKIRGRGDRGGRSLHVGRAPAILVEPFFGTNSRDCRAADDLGIAGMAQMYLDGIRRYANLPEVGDPDGLVLADVDIVHSGLTHEVFFDRNRAAIRQIIRAVNDVLKNEAHGEEINALTSEDAFALMSAQIATRGTKVDARHVHPSGNRGLLPLPRNVGFWNGTSSQNLGPNITPERNVKEYLLYLGNLKNKDIGRDFANGALYRDLFTQPGVKDSRRKQAALLGAIVSGYFDANRYDLGLPYMELTRRVVDAERNVAELRSFLLELGYRDAIEDPGFIDAQVEQLRAGIRRRRA